MREVMLGLMLATLCVYAAADGEPRAGFVTSEPTLSVGTVPITVWYPTEANDPSEYVVPAYQRWSPSVPVVGPPVQLVIPAGATRDAPIKGGRFPLILSNPGGEIGNQVRLRNYPNNERLAARGYVVVEAGRTVLNSLVDTELLRGLIDHMLYEHELAESIDGSKIGARASSFGGRAVAALAGAVDQQPDPRVRGVVFDEALNCSASSFDCSQVHIPVMLRDGSALLGPSGMMSEFASLSNAFPRFLVTLDNPGHTGLSTGGCGVLEAMRLASLDYQAMNGGIIEPEPRSLSYALSGLGFGDTAGFNASIKWNLNWFVPNIGSWGDYCRTEYGGPVPFPANAGVMDNQTMIETQHELNMGFWETVFSEGNSQKTKLEKAVDKLGTVTSLMVETE